MKRYIVARANRTAMAFVAKAEKEQGGWIVIARTADYNEACSMRDEANRK